MVPWKVEIMLSHKQDSRVINKTDLYTYSFRGQFVRAKYIEHSSITFNSKFETHHNQTQLWKPVQPFSLQWAPSGQDGTNSCAWQKQLQREKLVFLSFFAYLESSSKIYLKCPASTEGPKLTHTSTCHNWNGQSHNSTGSKRKSHIQDNFLKIFNSICCGNFTGQNGVAGWIF